MGIFSSCIDFVLENEGSEYTDDPLDNGGPTRFGITQEDYSQWLGESASASDVKAMSLQTAEQIYFRWYWTPLGLNAINNNAVCTCILDCGVNMGIGIGGRFAQQAANGCGANLIVDGHIGPLSVAAINNIDPNHFIQNYFGLVKARYSLIVSNNPSQEVFFKGWMNRANRLLTLVLPSTSGDLIS